MEFKNSLKLYQEAVEVIPMGTSTFSRNPNLFVIGEAPLFIQKAEGCRVYDVDGNEFIDYSMSLSIILMGYANKEINDAAKKGIDEGLIYTLSCPEEAQLAKVLTRLIPCAEMVRFSKNGSDTCEGAVRLARNYTKKLKIMTVGGYHGFHDWFTASGPRNKGIPSVMSEWVINHNYNDINAIENTIKEKSGEIAALIMEPVINFEPNTGFLEKIRELTEKNNIVLIFDEMKTGFRLNIGGAQKHFKVTPDLAIFGKAISNGFPLSALTGKKYLMQQLEDELCFLSASYATEKASLLASLKTIELLQRDNAIDHVWEMGKILKDGTRAILEKNKLTDCIKIVGFEPMTHLIMSPCEGFTVNEIKSFIQQECVRKGILFVGYHHPSYAHKKKDIEYTLEVYDKVFSMLKKAIDAKTLKTQIKGKVISAFGVRK